MQGHFADARRFCHDALRAAAEINDPWALAPAWLAGRVGEAEAAFTQAIAIYERLGVAQEIAYAEALRGQHRFPLGARHKDILAQETAADGCGLNKVAQRKAG